MFQDIHFLNAIQKQTERCNVNMGQGVISDIAQGSRYREALNAQGRADMHLTFTMNTDGVSLFTSSKKGSLWPVYLAINELLIKLRFSRKYLIACYLHCQKEKPNMLTYLTPMMETLKSLYDPGLYVSTPHGSVLHVEAQLLVLTLDLPAKAIVLNMKHFNGKYGCSFCFDKGESPPGYPMLRFYQYTNRYETRTHISMINDARIAVTEGDAVRGIKGVSAPMMLKYLDIPKAAVVDWMHGVLLGVTKALMTFWFNSKYKDKSFFIGNKIELLNKRFLKIKIPNYIARRQRTLNDHAHWKATEYREWLIHFSTPVLLGVLDSTAYVHFLLLVTSMFMLTKDALTLEIVEEARKMLNGFCKIYPQIYGEKSQTMNVHMLKHLPEFAKMYGPLFGYSCFGFESMNLYLKSMVHGTRHVNKQVSFAVGVSKHLGSLVKEISRENLDENIKKFILELSSKMYMDENMNEETTSTLGKKTILKDTHDFYPLLSLRLQNMSPKQFPRLKIQDTTYYSKNYQNARTRNDTVVCFIVRNVIKYGVILVFIDCEGNHFAVIDEYSVAPFQQNETISIGIQDLLPYWNDLLCPHIFKVTGSSGKVLVSVESLRKKCILIEIAQNQKYLSCPANLLEHN